MKKVVVLLVLSLFVVSIAFAETPTNKAIGYNNGISHRMMMDSGIGIEGILGLNYNASASDAVDAELDVNIGVNALKCLWETDGANMRANLNGFVGLGIMMDGSAVKDSDSVTDISISAGLEPEIFLLENLSVTTRLGVMIGIDGDTRGGDGKAIKDTGGTTFGTFGQGVSIVSGLAFNWYF